MNNVDVNYLREQLNNIELKNCEGIRVGDVLHYSIIYGMGVKKSIRSILRIIRNSMCNSYVYEMEKNSNTIMFFSNSYRKRVDHLEAFHNVSNTIPDCLKIIASRYHLKHFPHTLGLVCIWIRQLKRVKIGFWHKICLIADLQQCYCDYEQVERFCSKKGMKIKNAITVCDVMPVDSYFIQKCNLLDINTITLQHGTFCRGQYAYTNSNSKYFLAHSIFSKNCAIQSGMAQEKIYVVGAPQSINKEERIFSWKETQRIGLLLSGVISRDIKLIKMIVKYNQKDNYKIYVKLHPGFRKEDYPVDIWNNIEKSYISEIDIYKFADMVDFVIDNGSTAFIEYMAQNILSFTYAIGESAYKSDENIKLKFSTAVEMEDLFQMYKKRDTKLLQMLNDNRKYLATLDDPFELYSNFFKEHLIGD